MEITKTPERIRKLNDLYQKNEIHKNHWEYGREGRVRLLYHRAYIASQAPTVQLRRAEAEAFMLRNMKPVINVGELIVGLPDLTPLTEEEQKEYELLELAMQGAPRIRTAGGHVSLNFPKLLACGVSGILEEIEKYHLKLDPGDPESLVKEEFYMGCKMELEAVLCLAEKYARMAIDMSKTAEEPGKSELLKIAETMRRVPQFPATTFREALQSMHFFMFSLHNLFYFGRIDQYLYPYYAADLAAGRITTEEAQELLDCFFLIPAGYNGHSSAAGLTIGGRDKHGNPVENDLTKMILITCAHCRDCNNLIGYGITGETSAEFLKFAAEMAAETTEPVFFNDDAVTEAFVFSGQPLKDAREWCNTGCVLTTFKKCSGFGIGGFLNMPELLIRTMKKKPDSFEELKELFYRELRDDVVRGMREQNYKMLECSRQGHEVLRISALIDGCLESGRSMDQGGGIYSFWQPNFVGFANTVDSMFVLKRLVYDAGGYTMDDFLTAMEKDFNGYDHLLNEILHVPHFGMNDEGSNQIAQSVAEIVACACRGLKNYRGGKVLPGMFSYIWHAVYGADSPATPDGRRAGCSFANGINPASGMELNGPEASLQSEASWNQKLIPVSPSYSILFTPEKKGGPRPKELASFVRRYFELGGSMIQLSVVSIEEMRKALEKEDKDFAVGIGAFSVTMNEMKRLSEYLPEDILNRNEHDMAL